MKMRFLAMAALATAVSIVACKKSSKTDDPGTDETVVATQIAQHTDDQSRVSNDMDAVDNEINAAIESNLTFGREAEAQNVLVAPCDANITFDTTATTRRMIITFTGALCDSFRVRTGQITVTAPRMQRWRDSGAVLTANIVNLKITRRSDNKSITINGNRTLTNVSGGRVAIMQVGSNIVHRIDGSMSITFDDGSQRTWNVARQRTFTRPGNYINMSVIGTYSANGVTGISEWGTNRYGNAFTTRIAEPLKFNGECQNRLGAGKVVHSGLAHSVEVTFGLNAQGAAQATCPGPNPYYYKAVWTAANGNSQTVIRPYY